MQLADQPDAQAGVTPFWAHPATWLRTALQVSTIGREKAAVIDSEGNLWAGTLAQVIADLDHLNDNTEQDFLRIGEKLGEFIEAVNLISCELRSLASLISGEYGLRASQALTSALDHSREMAARVEVGNALLSSMRQDARLLKQNLYGFEETVSTFRTLGVLTRIETARLGNSGADFGHLADDVKQLAADVRTKVETVLPAAALLIPAIESAMQDIAALEEGQTKDLPSLISQVLANLSSLRDIEKQVYDASARLGDQYNAISDAFKKLIVSVQFHDITRQQVEHVIDVLRGLLSDSGGASGISHSQQDTAAVVALQSMQLADAGAKFAGSAASVVGNMDDIARHILEMADESRALSGLSGDETTSFLLQMEGTCTAIQASLSICATSQATIGATGGNLALIVGRTRGPVDDIQSIGIRMHRMAMNARIRAAHLGAAGEVLGVLAASMQELASECSDRTTSLSEALGSMSDVATRIAGQDGPASDSQPGSPDGVLQGMQLAVAELHSSSERSFAQIAQIIARGARLSEDVSATRRSFCVDALFAETISRSRRMLKEIEEANQSGLPHDRAEARERGLADFARHYTMQAERDVHEGVTKAVVGATPVAPVAVLAEQSPAKEAEEMGENVEFF
jgi:hypothetical protein